MSSISAPADRVRRVLVTGASSGIGAATVRRLSSEGMHVIAAARRADRLADLAAETGCEAFPLDVTDDAAVAGLVDHLSSTGGLDAVVNNAGGALGLDMVEDADLDGWRHMYELNVLGTLRVTRAVLPLLREAGHRHGTGDVLVVTSTAAHGAYEGGAGYTGVKHAERMLTTTLRWEIVGEPVRVLEVAPGNVATEEFSLVRFDGDAERAAKVYEGYQPLLAEDVADVISFGLTRPDHVNMDLMVVRPRAQAHNTKIARDPQFTAGT
ncbi:putative oxidoreductase [Corynebacterium provencense]|jgi:NADP-dependent 3-hydroxy acid dehydrogenase YdfG|uniref:Putative oxidoreductase n=1 Tax=Corynebacterium provencense TaxID=1737425 RepID=A0A2Z3YP09_9CORY|nr:MULTISPECIES: SDR family NAD(P)-dependent oxidoreductase [Corynebacterium]AWT25081.1 putative oxidoreductase [Corynebacterium provencense]MCI1255663.1 SDR family NAD(P)-dependent oxidoreductase [Corynebacterium provencense]